MVFETFVRFDPVILGPDPVRVSPKMLEQSDPVDGSGVFNIFFMRSCPVICCIQYSFWYSA